MVEAVKVFFPRKTELICGDGDFVYVESLLPLVQLWKLPRLKQLTPGLAKKKTHSLDRKILFVFFMFTL